MEKIKSYFSYSNIDSVVSGCNILVDSGQVYSYCCEFKTVRYYEDSEKAEGIFSCGELIGKDFALGLKEMNCMEVVC